MQRSFSDRVLGGVCGGMALALRRESAWGVRAVLLLLAVGSGGAVALLYLLLWWVLPMEAPIMREAQRRPTPLIPIVLLLVALLLTGLSWAAWSGATWSALYPPGLLVILGAVFFLRQLRG